MRCLDPSATFADSDDETYKPVVRGTDYAVWRRLKLIPFAVTIPDDEQDKALKDKLLAELPGILNWAILGCVEWQADGLGEPEEIRTATASYRDEMDKSPAIASQLGPRTQHSETNEPMETKKAPPIRQGL